MAEGQASAWRITGGANVAREPMEVVKAFCDAWSRRNVEEILAFFTDDGVYHNIPVAPATGKEAIRNLLNFILTPAQSVKFDITKIAAAGDTVLTERVDTFEMGGKQVVLPVAGVFEVRDGKIAAWRDYFDMATWTKQAS